MTVGFNGVTFEVPVVDDRFLPIPTPDEAGFDYYEATIRLASRTLYDSMYNLLSGVDIIPAMGMRGGGLVVTTWGVGPKTLIYPRGEYTEASITAILISLSPQSAAFDNEVDAEARFLKVG